MTDVMDIADIDVGERDRTDMGDIAELAASIDAVGLLHPVVITADRKLIAGDRRLAAVRELGWLEVPVTVVDLESAADVLQAEMEENTCRKALTGYEADRARERRERILKPKAQAAQGKRTDLQPSANLAEGKPSTQRETRKVGAAGTGYSGSTLDKVRTIRNAAERGVVRQGKAEVPAPEPVQQAAREALAEVQQTGAAIDASHRKVAEAIERYVEDDVDVQRARRVKAWFDALRTARSFREFDVTALPPLLSAEDWESSALLVDGLADQIEKFRAARPGRLRVVNGGQE